MERFYEVSVKLAQRWLNSSPKICLDKQHSGKIGDRVELKSGYAKAENSQIGGKAL